VLFCLADGFGKGCCFTWKLKIAGVDAVTRGVYFYEVNNGLVTYIQDTPEPAIRPPPLQLLASILEPGLRRFRPLTNDLE